MQHQFFFRPRLAVLKADLIEQHDEDYCLNPFIAKPRCNQCGGRDVGITLSWGVKAAAERGSEVPKVKKFGTYVRSPIDFV